MLQATLPADGRRHSVFVGTLVRDPRDGAVYRVVHINGDLVTLART